MPCSFAATDSATPLPHIKHAAIRASLLDRVPPIAHA